MVLLALLATAHFFFAAEELIHIFFFGALGFSLRQDAKRKTLEDEFFLFGLIVCISDELLQSLLPWRVGDVRDVVLNIVSFILGYFIVADRALSISAP